MPPPPTPTPPPPPPWFPVREREHRPDVLGLVGLALFLIVLGLVFAANPNLGGELRLWTERIARDGIWTRPPEGIITSAALFFALTGASGIFVAALRFLVGRVRFRALADALTGLAGMAFAYLLTLYANRTIGGQTVFALEAAVVGAFILVYIIIGLYWGFARRIPAPEARRPFTRP